MRVNNPNTPHPSLLPQGEKGPITEVHECFDGLIPIGSNMNKARQLRKNMTDAERLLWRELRSRQVGGQKFRRQQPLGRFVVNFVCLEKRLVIEVDGGHHAEVEQAAYDADRTVWLRREGFCVLRFWDHEVLKDLDAVTEAVSNALSS